MSGILFFLLSFILIILTLGVISSKNSVYSALFLIASFIISSFILIILGAEYIAMTIAIVYVGAIMVLFLFVIMMLKIQNNDSPLLEFAKKILRIFIPILCLVLAIYFKMSSNKNTLLKEETSLDGISSNIEVNNDNTADNLTTQKNTLSDNLKDTEIRQEIEQIQNTNEINQTEIYPVNNFTKNSEHGSITSITNTQLIGSKLYTRYILQFQLAGIILLVAMIGVIILGFYRKKHTKRQNITKQLTRNSRKSIELLNVECYKGLEESLGNATNIKIGGTKNPNLHQ